MRHLLNSLCIILLCLAAPVVRAAGVKTTCSGCEPGELAFARSEIDAFFAPAIAGTELEGNCRIRLECDPSIDDGSFGYRSEDGRRITVYGGDPISVTNGLHTLLERMGFLFDITGVTRPERADLAALDHADVRIRPNVRWRGIRQHVNFPMDISSYPIDQAKRYLENLVRMRFNKFVVHSYIFMWHEEPVSQDSTNYAGSFFYGHRHDFSDSPFLKSVNRENRSIFCIPDIEPCYDDVPERSKRAVAWMGELLDYAKSLGLYVQFSYEPRHSTVERAVRLGQIIARTYPRIDALELMTEETGGWGPSYTAEEVRAKLLEFFPSDVLSDTLVMNAIRDRQPDMAELYHQIGTNMEAIRRMECDPGMKGIRKFVLGIYCSIPDHVGPAYHLAVEVSCPATISRSCRRTAATGWRRPWSESSPTGRSAAHPDLFVDRVRRPDVHAAERDRRVGAAVRHVERSRRGDAAQHLLQPLAECGEPDDVPFCRGRLPLSGCLPRGIL